MLIAYLTHDEVNASVASRLAARLGLAVTVLPVKHADRAVAADHLVLDLDHLPPESKSNLFLRARCGHLRSGVTVHSYNLTAREVTTLRAAGVRVVRRLVTATFALAVGSASG